MDTKKQAIVDALYAWINQRPGLDPANYFCGGNWQENRRNYDSERRRILRQRNDALALLRSVELRDSISADDMLEGFSAFSGRLTCKVEPRMAERDERSNTNHYRVTLDYCAGQYWPTEYRAAAAAVCASILWNAKRENMPSKIVKDGEEFYPHVNGTRNLVSAGDWLRSSFRREYGASMQRRYFD